MDFDQIREKIRAKIPYARLVPIKADYRWGAVGGVPVLILVLLAFFLIKPIMGETTALEEELAQVQNEVQIKRGLARRLPDLEQEIENKDYELTLLRKQLPEEKEIPDLLDQVSNLGTQAGLEFITFKPLGEVEKDFYAEVPVQLRMVGRFHELLTFFDRVSRMPRIVTITDMSIKKAAVTKKGKGSNVARVDVTSKAITFRFLEAKVDIVEEQKKGKKKGKKKRK